MLFAHNHTSHTHRNQKSTKNNHTTSHESKNKNYGKIATSCTSCFLLANAGARRVVCVGDLGIRV